MLTVITPATSYDLTTIAVVKAELDISGSAEDVALARYIAQASASIVSYCGRTFARETVAETFRTAQRERMIVLARYPVASITSVAENGVTLGAGAYELDANLGALFRLQDDGVSQWAAGKIVVIYSGGYILPSMAGTRTLPEDIERAAIATVARLYRDASRDTAIRRESVDDVGAVDYFGASASGLPQEAEAIMMRYRAPAI